MDESFFKGVKIALGFIFTIGVLFGIVFAVGFHSANEILGGTFLGDYEFQGSVKLNNAIVTCDGTKAGSLKYNNTQLLLCNGTNWNSVSISSNLVTVPGIDGYTKLLLHFDNSFVDVSTSSHSINTNGGVSASSSGQFSTSGLFDGTDDYLSIADSSDWDFSGDFTIDFWLKIDDTNSALSQTIYGQYQDGSNYWFLSYVASGNYFRVNNREGGSGIETYDYAWNGIDLNSNQWYHIALVRSGSNNKLYVDGVSIGGTYSDAQDLSYVVGGVQIGSLNSNYLDGYIDELRISKGIARWTTDFSVPAGPYS